MILSSTQVVSMVMPSSQRRRPIVLHVDDDAASLMMAEGALEDAGFDVVHATNGQQAIDQFRHHDPDLIIMDAVMPIMDGFEAISAIRNLSTGAHVPILMITGLEDLDSITRAYDEGATDFLVKPVNFFILPHRVQYMMRSKLTADALRSSQAKLDNAQRIARLGNWEWTIDTMALSGSRECGNIINLPIQNSQGLWSEFLEKIDEADKQNVRLMAEQAVEEAQSFSVEFTITNGNGESRCVRLEAEPHVSETGQCTHMLGTVQDITERTNAQQQIHTLAYFDLVTGLPNRAQLNEKLRQALKHAARNDSRFALLFLDLDHFKQVNDTLGHDAGDELLQQVADRLTLVVRESDAVGRMASDDEDTESRCTVARLGGDEFVVLLGEINRAEDAARVAERIATTISEPYAIGDSEVSVTTTIGISVYPADGEDSDTLMKHADVAMYHAKESGRNGYQFYSHGIHEQALARFSLERDLREAIENEDLTLDFQPKISCRTHEIVGVEALVRWNHPEAGAISPSEFIPLAEETGLILPLGQWVLQNACQKMQQWIDAGLQPMTISVNCSPIQFKRSDILSEIDKALTISGLDPQLLELEITEGLLLQDLDTGIEILTELKARGIQAAIDDFGTGFSSLNDLRRLPVSKLKVDQSFVRELEEDKGSAAIVSSIITLSHNLGMQVVAEGVETQQQLRMLREYGCDEVQGYLISYPLPEKDFIDFISSHSPFALLAASGR